MDLRPRDNRGMPVSNDTFARRRHLPHLEKSGKSYFITFATIHREVLPPIARDIALSCCVHDHRILYWLHSAVIMPDHVHAILTPCEQSSLSTILDAIKGASAHLINRNLGRRGHLWQDESFDRILRAGEEIRKKAEYICNNPVRAGLATTADDWPWIWREWAEGRRDSRGRLSSTV